MVERQRALNVRKQAIEDFALVKYARRTKEDVERFMDRLMREPRVLQKAVRFWARTDPTALEAARRHIWDRVDPTNASMVENFLESNRRSLEILFDKKHLNALGVIQRARKMIDFVGPPRGGAIEAKGVVQKAERLIGQKFTTLGTRLFAFHSGRMQKGYLVLDTLRHSLYGKQAQQWDEFLRETLYNRELATSVSDDIINRSVSKKTINKLNTWIFNSGITLGEEDEFQLD